MVFASKDMKRLNHLIGEINKVYHEISTSLGLADSVMDILYTLLDQQGSCLLRDICILTGMSKQTVNSAIRKLEGEKFIRLEALGTKSKIVYLTEDGELFANRTVSKVIEAENQIFSLWSMKDVDLYLSLMQRYLDGLKEQAQSLKGG